MQEHLQSAGQWMRSSFAAKAAAAPSAALDSLSSLPYRLRRNTLKFIFTLLKPVVTGRANASASEAFSRLLMLSPRAGRQFMYRKLVQDMIYMTEWLALGRRSVAGLIADTRHLSTDSPDDIQWLARQRGAIIGTMHFGPYPLGLAWLIHTYFQGRKIIIFKSDLTSDAEQRAIDRLGELGADVEFVTSDALQHFHRLIKAVRNGAIVVIMIDLPPDYGRSDTLDLLGHRISIASGVVDLAALSCVPLMLLRVRSLDTGGDRLEIGDVFDVARHDPGSRERAVGRIARFVGDTLHHYPDQWQMWGRFAEYLPQPQGAAS